MNLMEKKEATRSYMRDVGWAMFGIILALVFLFVGIIFLAWFASLFGIGGDSYVAALFGLFSLVALFILGYFIYRLLRNWRKLVLARFFWWTILILDSLLILIGLFYLSL